MEFNNVLEAIAYYYGSDKCPQIGHFYTEYYYGLLKDKRESIKKLLEIGVGAVENMNCHCKHYKDAASLYTWQDFLPRAQIYGIDILPSLVFKDNRIETFLCDQYNKEDLENLISKIGSDIDIVIDDGSHKPKHQVFTCRTLMPLLKKDVIYQSFLNYISVQFIETHQSEQVDNHLKFYLLGAFVLLLTGCSSTTHNKSADYRSLAKEKYGTYVHYVYNTQESAVVCIRTQKPDVRNPLPMLNFFVFDLS